jgi:rubrerythrin
LYGREAKLRVLSALEASSEPESPAVAELIRAMDAAVEHLADALSCAVALADGRRQPCSFHLDGEECSCERCGQLLSEWELGAAAALECALPDSNPLAEEADGPNNDLRVASTSGNLAARAEKVQALFHELEDVFGGLTLPARAGEAGSPSAKLATGKCEGCGMMISGNTKFCPHCGRTVQGRRCLSCNGPVDREMKFCPTCGAKAA